MEESNLSADMFKMLKETRESARDLRDERNAAESSYSKLVSNSILFVSVAIGIGTYLAFQPAKCQNWIRIVLSAGLLELLVIGVWKFTAHLMNQCELREIALNRRQQTLINKVGTLNRRAAGCDDFFSPLVKEHFLASVREQLGTLATTEYQSRELRDLYKQIRWIILALFTFVIMSRAVLNIMTCLDT